MTVKDLIAKLQTIPEHLQVCMEEGKKHDDHSPLMDIIEVEHAFTDQDDEVCVIVSEPNPETIVPMTIEKQSTLNVNAELMRQGAKAIEPYFPGKGFALVVYDFGEGLRDFRYISNSRRVDMIATFEALLAKWKNEKIVDN